MLSKDSQNQKHLKTKTDKNDIVDRRLTEKDKRPHINSLTDAERRHQARLSAVSRWG